MPSLLASSLPGRLRARLPTSAEPGLLESVCERLSSLSGVTACEARPAARSLVVRYDPSILERWEVEDAVREAILPNLPEPEREALQGAAEPLSRRANRYAKIGGAASLGVSLAAAAAGRRNLHIWSGCAFVGCLGVHLYVSRGKMFA